MKNTTTNSNNWPLLLVVAIASAGAGITGTLLWTQSHPSVPDEIPLTPTIGSQATTAVAPVPDPPATLTEGRPPAEAALLLGNWYFDHKAWSLAIKHYQGAIKRGADNPDVRTDLGSAYRFAGQPQQALEQYHKAQQQNPLHENSLYNQGGLYAVELKQPQQAILAWRMYLKRFPQGQHVAQARQLIAETEAKLPKR